MLRVTRHGAREMLIGSVVLLVVLTVVAGSHWGLVKLIVIPLIVAVLAWLFAFFRDPERVIPHEEHLMVSPADGTVSDITNVDNDALLGCPAVRVGIFLSVFNVHINRSPCQARVKAVNYKKGKFINAMQHNKASDENESNTVVLEEVTTGRPIAVVKQIVGLIARRIIFTASPGTELQRGERIGMIKFGSRTELVIPQWLEPTIAVQIGQKVRGGADIVARLGKPVHTLEASAPVGEEYEPIASRQTPA